MPNFSDQRNLCNSSGTVESSSEDSSGSKGTTGLNLNIEDGMKRATVKERIEKYFYQLTDGCGNEDCKNENCASSGKLAALSPNEAARNEKTFLTEKKLLSVIEDCKAINNYTQLRSILFEVFSNQDFLSESFRKATSREQLEEFLPQSVIASMTPEQLTQYTSPPPTLPSTEGSGDSPSSLSNGDLDTNLTLDIKSVRRAYEQLFALPSSEFEHTLVQALVTLSELTQYTSPPPTLPSTEGSGDSPSSLSNGDLDTELTLDIKSVRRAYEQLFALPSSEFEHTLVQALVTLSEYINVQLRCGSSLLSTDSLINVFLVIFEIPSLGGCDYVERALPKICKAASQLPLTAQARIARIWAAHCKQRLKTILEALQQLITIKTISNHYHKDYILQDEETITLPTKIMRILFYANILAGDLDPPCLRDETQDPEDNHESMFGVDISSSKSSVQANHYEDSLAKLLQINVLDSRKPLIPFLEFYNEPLSDAIEMDRDFGYYRASEELTSETDCASSSRFLKFSFMYYSFILTPATKTLGLYYDSRIRMYSGRRISYLQSVVGQPTNPYLRLKVRRDHIIEDALVELEMIAMENEKDLKKQLVVEFEGEQGIDEGGVSKEFFQLIIEEIFNPDYGMFCVQSDTQHMWFNQMSFESDAQFTLVGIILGLAIYNNIILDVNFPMVVYKKLMGKRGSFYDLEDFNPVLFNGLRDLLDYEGQDMEDVFSQTFRICFTDPFGAFISHDLKPDGDNIAVTQENKQEFIDLYSDFLLNTSIEKQFKAFRRGFQMVTDESPLSLLFRPEEIEQLVCGSNNTSIEKQFKAFRRGFQMVTDESPLSLLFRPEEIEQLVCGSN
ncbi:ubiquitin-protein ligase E3A [Diaphorina citri]|uniref:HECT-type E3 ubiquitin transferase n=1 Tax=Diaphorina citri TaxID=121845 RepID=A0A3Q0J135_DIACI|nr:ubiquitin-protein ligase E3A [Diaphorina citri]